MASCSQVSGVGAQHVVDGAGHGVGTSGVEKRALGEAGAGVDVDEDDLDERTAVLSTDRYAEDPLDYDEGDYESDDDEDAWQLTGRD